MIPHFQRLFRSASSRVFGVTTRKSLLLGATVGLFATPGLALAQARAPLDVPATQLDEVVVTGQRNQPAAPDIGSRLGLTAREIPATIEVLDSETIRRLGINTFVETIRTAAGVTSADTAQHTPFTMRGFQMAQVSVTHNGINLGSTDFTGMNMGTFNLERVEFLKGPSSIVGGQGAVGGLVNFVTKSPHAGRIENELMVGFDERGTYRVGFGSGGSTRMKGLDYRFDISRSDEQSFIEDSHVEYTHLSGGLDYQVTPTLKAFVAAEYKDLQGEIYEGTPLVSAAFSGEFATTGIVRGTHVSSFNGTNLGAVTVDRRTLETNYNILDDDKTIDEAWLRAGLEWTPRDDVTIRALAYGYDASRTWHNNEVIAFNATTGLVDRERFYVHHDQRNIGLNTDLTWNGQVFGLNNRMVVALEYYDMDFVRPGAANFPGDSVSLIDPVRGTYGLLTTARQTTTLESVAINVEDRLELTPTFALVGGLRYNNFDIERTSADVAGVQRPGFPLSQDWDPVTGRIGFTWDVALAVTVYGQYATASDVAVGSYFLLSPTQRMELSEARSYETGVKASFWAGRGQATVSLFDIERSNIYSAAANQRLNLAGTLNSEGVEVSTDLRPTSALHLWGNASYVHARYDNYELTGASFSGNTPPNIPTTILNGGGSYRFTGAPLPVELGVSVAHVGDRYTTDGNTVEMPAYTTADLFAIVDLPASGLLRSATPQLTFRVKNVTDEQYAAYGDPFYPDQVFLGAPRTFEMSASVKF